MSLHQEATALLSTGAHAVVLRGDPSPEEVAAVVIVLNAAQLARGSQATQRPSWLRASRLEGLGAKPLASPADLLVASVLRS